MQNSRHRTRKAILSESFISLVFSDMFSLPHPITDESRDETRPETTNGLPFVHLSENGAVIDTLLRYGYPLTSPLTTDSYLLSDVPNAAEKYDMIYAMLGIKSPSGLQGSHQLHQKISIIWPRVERQRNYGCLRPCLRIAV